MHQTQDEERKGASYKACSLYWCTQGMLWAQRSCTYPTKLPGSLQLGAGELSPPCQPHSEGIDVQVQPAAARAGRRRPRCMLTRSIAAGTAGVAEGRLPAGVSSVSTRGGRVLPALPAVPSPPNLP